MSYSFSFVVPTKAQAKVRAALEMAKVVDGNVQPQHAQDMPAAIAAAHAMIDLLADDQTKHVAVSVSGWIQWQWVQDNPAFVPLTGTNVSVSASLVAPVTPAE